MALWVPCRYIYLEDGSDEVLGTGIINKNPTTVTSFHHPILQIAWLHDHSRILVLDAGDDKFHGSSGGWKDFV